MQVLHYSIILARTVNAQRVHIDLTHVPGSPEYFGLFDPIRGEWLEQFSEAEALARLQSWPTITPRPGGPRLPYSEVLAPGVKWLAQHGT